MGARKKAAKAAATAKAQTTPVVQRIVEDEDLRQSITQAYESARDAYSRLQNGKSPKELLDDKKLHKDIKQAAEHIRDASTAFTHPRKKRGGFFRKLVLLAIAGGLALALSEDLRKKVLDALFGAEEEFEYTSTTTPPGTGATGGTTIPTNPPQAGMPS